MTLKVQCPLVFYRMGAVSVGGTHIGKKNIFINEVNRCYTVYELNHSRHGT